MCLRKKHKTTAARDPVEREVNLKDVVKFNWGFQGATQGAGTPNQAGLGFFSAHDGER